MKKLALSIKDLRKTYKDEDVVVEALKGIDLEVEQGDFFSLLGPNGAGKTTAINIITSLVNKTSGKVKVFGKDIDKDLEEVKSVIGVTPQEFNFNIFDKVWDILIWQAGYYGIDKKTAAKRAEKYLKQLGLWDKKDSVARTLSGGLKRRLMIARALIHKPKLIILDEPTAGVDIETRISMWKFIRELNEKGTTIILTTHYLEEAENLCRNIAIIDKGKIVEKTSTKNLLKTLDKETFIFDLDKELKKLPKLKGYELKIIDEKTLEVEILGKQNLNNLFEYFKKSKIEIISMRRKTARLEELFMNLLEKGKNGN
jgi:ABC-2 type transport system ATP-binding protein